MSWQPMKDAPLDGTEILAYSVVGATGVLLVRWTCPAYFLTEAELEGLIEEDAYAMDWFYADFVSPGRLDPGCPLAAWMHVPKEESHG